MTSSDPSSTPPTRLCVDANFVLRFVMPDERDPAASALWTTWGRQGIQVIGPTLLYAEVISGIRYGVVRGRIDEVAAAETLTFFNSLNIQRIDHDALYPRAWDLARRYNQRRIYDMLYVALAELEDVEFWTGDERLVNTLGGREPRLRWVPVPTSPPHTPTA